MAVLKDLCANSRFVHAQMWVADADADTLTYAGMCFAKPRFLAVPKP